MMTKAHLQFGSFQGFAAKNCLPAALFEKVDRKIISDLFWDFRNL
jgi:hypothetical protein